MPPRSNLFAAQDRHVVERLRNLRPVLCGVVALIATLALIGWGTGIQRLQSVGPGMISMKVNTATGLILLAVAIFGIDRRSIGWRVAVWVCLTLAATLAGGTLIEYATGFDFHIDDVVVHDAVSPRFPGRMAPATAIVLSSVAAAGALLQAGRAIGAAQVTLVLVSAAPLTTLGGYLYRAPAMYAAVPYPVIALHTSICLMLLCFAGLIAHPDRALMSVVTARTLAGTMARRLLPASVAVPLIVGLGVLAGQHADWYSAAFGSALLVGCCATFFAAVVWWSTATLARTEAVSKRAEAERERLVAKLDAERNAIAVSERQRWLALDAAELGSWNIDAATLALTTDARFRMIFGIDGDDCTYEQVFAAIHPEDRERARVAVKASMQPDDPVPYAAEYRIVRRDGSIRWAFGKGRANVVDGPDGRRLLSLDGTIADVTERKAAEADLTFQQHQLELIFRESPAAMALWRGDDLIFERVNPEYQDLFRGRTLVGLPLLDACPELRGQGFDDLIRHVMQTGEPFVGREALARIVREKGGPIDDRYFDFSFLQVVDAQGRPWGVYDHAVDVTDRVLARQGLEQSQTQLENALSERQMLLDAERAARADIERAGRMKDEFLATLSHELRTPLSAILGWSQILRRSSPTPDVLAEGLATIERNARAQTQIIEDLLDMSRIISGKVSLDPQRINLSAVLRAAVETVRATAAAKHVEIIYEAGDETRQPIVGDLIRLQQVFWNVLSNAIKFTPSAGRVRVNVEQRHSMWQVDVIDTGEGISPDFLPYVFDRFRQADASTTRQHGGLGLGLSIVKQLVELHGGKVRARSDGAGHGSTITVSLPVRIIHDEADRTPDAASAAEVSSSIGAGAVDAPASDGADWEATLREDVRGKTILIVDDEPDARAMLKQLMEQCEARVLVAATADETLELLQRERPDVLVSDIGMPVVDGYELIRRVRALPADQGGATPAIALTAYARVEDRMRAVRAGFQMHVPKPVEPAELMTMIASVLR